MIQQLLPKKNIYLSLLRENDSYRRLFYARTISFLGDWLNLIAMFELLGMLSDSTAKAYGIVIVIKMLPIAICSPIGGVLADRFNRKHIMVFSDIARFVCVSLFLLSGHVADPTFVYLVLLMQALFSGLFDPAYHSFLPGIVKRENLLTANALSAMMWSIMLTFGSALGGFATEFFGWQFVIICNAAIYLFSAWLIVKIPSTHQKREMKKSVAASISAFIQDTKMLFAYLRARKELFALTLLKGIYMIGGASSLVIAVYGETINTFGKTAAFGISILYVGRGVGTGLGPIIGRRIVGDSIWRMRLFILLGFIIPIICYQILSVINGFFAAFVCLLVSHLGSSFIYFFSTTMIQMEAESEVTGRIFGLDIMLLTFASAISTLLYSWAMEENILDMRGAASLMSWSWCIGLVVWSAVLISIKKQESKS